MFAINRWLPRLACAIALSACADATDPTAPSAAAPPADPHLFIEGEPVEPIEPIESVEPTPQELAEMPGEFQSSPIILTARTDVGFILAENRTFAQAFMKYFATNATQEVSLSLRFAGNTIARTTAFGENSAWLPLIRTLWTTALLGVSGACGHLADGATVHKAWHQFPGSGWKFFSWGNAAETTGNSREQAPCPPPPPPQPPSTGGSPRDEEDPTEYDGSCYSCELWYRRVGDVIVARWWECRSIDSIFCEIL